MKKLLYGMAGVILIAATGAASWYYWYYLSFDQVARRAIERYGSEAIQGQLRVRSVRMSPTDGVGFISGLSVENPPGFRTPTAISADSVKIELAPRSLAGNVLAIRVLAIASPRISYETGDGGSNFDALLKGIRLAASAPAPKPPDRMLNLTVGHLAISNATLSYTQADGQAITIEHLPDIRLTNIGQNRGGATPEELALAITEATLYQISRALPAGPAPGRQKGAAGN